MQVDIVFSDLRGPIFFFDLPKNRIRPDPRGVPPAWVVQLVGARVLAAVFSRSVCGSFCGLMPSPKNWAQGRGAGRFPIIVNETQPAGEEGVRA